MKFQRPLVTALLFSLLSPLTLYAAPTATPTLVPVVATCGSYSSSVVAFYGGNRNGQLRDAVGSNDLLMQGAVGNPQGAQPEGDRWLGSGFSGASTTAWLNIPTAVWPGNSGAIEAKLLYASSGGNNWLKIEHGSDYLSLYISDAASGFDLYQGGAVTASPASTPVLVNGGIYDIRVEWGSFGVRTLLNGTLFASSPVTLGWNSVSAMYVGVFPTVASRDLASKIDALAVLSDPAGIVCMDAPAPMPTCGMDVSGYSGQGNAGDILVSLRVSGGLIQRLDAAPNGTYYDYANISDAHLDGLTTDYDDPNKIRASREDNSDVVLLDASGAIVPGQTLIFPPGVKPKISSIDPKNGDFYVPDQAGNGIWYVKHGTLAPVMLPGSNLIFNQAIASVFDLTGNLYIADTHGQKIWRYSAVDLAAWMNASVTPVPTVYDDLGVNIDGLVYDGGNHLYGIASDGASVLVDVVMGVNNGVQSRTYLTWPALPNVPPAMVGQHPGSPDGIVMGLDGNLWAVEVGATMRGLFKMDTHGNILDWRPLTVTGEPDDLAVAGLFLPHGPVCAASTPSATPTITWTPTPTPVTTFNGPGACPVTSSLGSYSGVGSVGDILISTYNNTHLVGFNPSTESFYIRATGTTNVSGDVANDPSDLSKILVVQGGNLYRYDSNGTNLGLWGSSPAVDLQLGEFAPDGSYWIPDQVTNKLYRFPAGGGAGQVMTLNPPLSAPTACIFDKLGNLYISDSLASRVMKVLPADQSLVTPTASVLFSGLLNVYGMAYDGDHTIYFTSGGSGSSDFYKADTVTGVYTVLDSNFAPLSENGGSYLYHGSDVAFGQDGALYVAMNQNPGSSYGILKMDTNGTPLKYYRYPASIGGYSSTGWWVDGLGVQGLSSLRVCGLTPSPSATPSYTSTPTVPPTATPTTSPVLTTSSSPSSTLTSTATPSPTPSPTSTQTQTPFTGLTPVISATSTRTPSPPVTIVPSVTPIPNQTCIVVLPPKPGSRDPIRTVIRAETGGLCSVNIYRPEGRICKRVWQGPLMPKEQKLIIWNGNDEADQDVASGIYLVVFTDGDGKPHRAKVAIIR